MGCQCLLANWTHHNRDDHVQHNVLDIGSGQECYKEREDARSI
jgi:hypothetical protein